MRHAVVLRPAPGADRTITALTAAGLAGIGLPLFAVRPVAWTMPAGDFDAVVLTSANAVRHAGTGIAALGLPVMAVGPATATAAQAAGLTLAATGEADVATLLATHAARYPRLLHLAGRDRVDDPRLAATVTVYAVDPLPIDPAALAVLAGSVALVHSPRAAIRLGRVMAAQGIDRGATRLAALSAAVAAAAGDGWDAVAVADRPIDAAIVIAARRLAD